jgi:hypothetical protein
MIVFRVLVFRTVDIYVVAADQATASELTPSFEKVLAAVG